MHKVTTLLTGSFLLFTLLTGCSSDSDTPENESSSSEMIENESDIHEDDIDNEHSEIDDANVNEESSSISMSSSSEASSPSSDETTTNDSTLNSISRAVVVDCSTLETSIGSKAVSILSKYNYKKCAMVAGILIANSNETVFNGLDITALTQQQADILSELLDNNQDGIVDNPLVVAKLKTSENGAWMNIQSINNESNEENIVEELRAFVGSDMGVKHSWMSEAENDGSLGIKHVMTEEAIHMWHMLGYAKAYPQEWGVSDEGCQEESSLGCNFNQSTLTKLTFEAMSENPTWYRHPENSTISNGVITGTCIMPSCASVEFIMNVLVEYRDIYAAVSEAPMPTTKSAMDTKLNSTQKGQDMKAILDSSVYNQLPNGMSYSYNPN